MAGSNVYDPSSRRSYIDLNGLIVKFPNAYGVEHDPEKSRAITEFIRKAQPMGQVDMMTDGAEMRQLLYVDDSSGSWPSPIIIGWCRPRRTCTSQASAR